MFHKLRQKVWDDGKLVKRYRWAASADHDSYCSQHLEFSTLDGEQWVYGWNEYDYGSFMAKLDRSPVFTDTDFDDEMWVDGTDEICALDLVRLAAGPVEFVEFAVLN
jgi:hypothetical protein